MASDETLLHPPLDWFEAPADGIPTDKRLTITADGRVFGYVALWNSCHVGAEGCIPPPKGSPTDYEYAHVGETVTADGSTITTAIIAGNMPHVGEGIDSQNVPDLYANAGKQMMRVRYFETPDGLAFAGALMPGLTDADVERIRASALSGDWRYHPQWRYTASGGYDFSGTILVNVPGFRMDASGSIDGERGYSRELVASAVPRGFDGIIGSDDQYFRIHPEDTVSDQTTTATNANDGGGCGCGGGKKPLKAGSFNGSPEDLMDALARHILMALEEIGLTGDDVEAAAVTADGTQAAAEGEAGSEGATPSAGADLDGLNMKVDSALEGISRVEAMLAELLAGGVAAELAE